MANTYEPISTTTLSTASASVTFSSISGSYTDLVVVFDGTAATGDYNIILTFNSDTGSNYSWTDIEGNGSSAASYRLSNQTGIKFAYNLVGTSTSQCNTIMHIMNYSNTTTYKTALGRVNSATAPIYKGTTAGVGLWRNTNAITSVKIQLITENFNSGSTFTLYGIKAA
jgi:hypothetical protein